ncbi:MAG: ferritin-like domain-containing protein [Pseudomonadota bacterium]
MQSMKREFPPSRRRVLGATGLGLLSAGAVAILGAEPAFAGMKKGATAQDVDILNVALGLEHEAIEAYQIGAESGLVSKEVLPTAVLFQSHHKGHRDALIGAIRQMGGAPVEARARKDYVEALNVASLRDQADVLRLAARLERGAANAYLGVIPSFGDRTLSQVAARLAADETMHWTALAHALAEALPQQPLSFGA